MQVLRIEERADTPFVNLNHESGNLTIHGRSVPEDVTDFYKPIFNWLEEYLNHPAPETFVDIKLFYYNTASSKIFLDLFLLLEELSEKGKSVKVKWMYIEEDDVMLEAGEDYSTMVDFPFEFESYPNPL